MARIYEAKAMDLELALCNTNPDATGAAGVVSKDGLTDRLKRILDQKTIDKIPSRFRPIALRWRLSPKLGLPLTPFRVYKRDKSKPYAEKNIATFSFGSMYVFTSGSYWTVTFQLSNTAMFPVTVSLSPLNQNYVAIAGAEYSRTINPNSSITVKLSYPNINGLIFNGGAVAVTNLTGVNMTDIVNDPAWELVEIVGLPFKTGTPDPLAYKNEPQGYPTNLKDGNLAAADRVDIARLFYNEPTYLQPDSTTLPAWKVPTGAQLITSMQSTQPDRNGYLSGILYDVSEMLLKVHQNPSLYVGEQHNFKKKTLSGSFSDGVTPATDTATLENPVCNTTLLGGAIDCWNSLGIGMGTTDFAALGGNQQFDEVNNPLSLGYEYMISAYFQVPAKAIASLLPPKLKFLQYDTMEFATLAHPASGIGAVGAISIDNYTENRPDDIDKPYSKESKIYWNKPLTNFPVSYAIAVKDAMTGQLGYLNKNRAFLNGYPLPFFPAERADADAPNGVGADSDQYVRYYHHKNPMPFTVSARKDYYIAGLDVFGRWSTFTNGFTNLVPKPPIAADIISAKFNIDISDKSDHIYPAELELVVAWHWDDRRPAQINIGGHFIPIPASPSTINPDTVSKVAGLDMGNTIADNRNYTITFPSFDALNPSASAPVLMKGSPPVISVTNLEGTVIIDKTGGDTGNTTKYKIRLKGFQLNFETTSRLAIGLYLRDSENINPSLFTSYGLPKVITINDPLPWPPPPLDPDIKWSSLPDAANISRYHVSFTPVPNVAGYAIYRASETDLRHKVGLPPIDPAAPADLNGRWTDLFTLNDNDKRIGKDAFIRLNTTMLSQPSIDAELPGELNGFYIYAVTTFTTERVESKFSSWLIVAVPHRYMPGSPVLSAFTKKMGTQRQIQLNLELPQGVNTEMLEIYRTNKSHIAAVLDYMGLPAMTGGVKNLPANWQAFDKDNVLISPVTVDSKVVKYQVTELVAPGWQPYFYRAAGYGPYDKKNGKFPGKSKSSNMIEILVAPPEAPPLLKNLLLVPFDAAKMKLSFATDADIVATPYGNFKITVEKLNNINNIFENAVTKEVPMLLKKQPADVPVVDSFYRVDKDGTGSWNYEYYPSASDDVTLKVTITDPLGRSTTSTVHYKKPAVVLPPIVIKDPVLKVLLTSTEIVFNCSFGGKPITNPPYLLEILAVTKLVRAIGPRDQDKYNVLLSQTMDTIGIAVPRGTSGVYKEDALSVENLFTYHVFFRDAASIDTIKTSNIAIRVTDADGKVTIVNIP